MLASWKGTHDDSRFGLHDRRSDDFIHLRTSWGTIDQEKASLVCKMGTFARVNTTILLEMQHVYDMMEAVKGELTGGNGANYERRKFDDGTVHEFHVFFATDKVHRMELEDEPVTVFLKQNHKLISEEHMKV